MGTKSPTRTFAEKFEQALAHRELGVRTVARRIVERDGVAPGPLFVKRVDNVRRQLNKYRAGVIPTIGSRHAIEDAMDMERDSLKADDEEGEKQVLRFLVPVEVPLTAALDDLVAEAIERHHAKSREPQPA